MTQHRFRHACCDVRSINAVTMFQCADEVAPVSTQLAQLQEDGQCDFCVNAAFSTLETCFA